jgi:hypothetical protein
VHPRFLQENGKRLEGAEKPAVEETESGEHELSGEEKAVAAEGERIPLQTR